MFKVSSYFYIKFVHIVSLSLDYFSGALGTNTLTIQTNIGVVIKVEAAENSSMDISHNSEVFFLRNLVGDLQKQNDGLFNELKAIKNQIKESANKKHRKRRKRKTMKKHKVMTKQTRKVDGVTRVVRKTKTGRRYVLLHGHRKYL